MTNDEIARFFCNTRAFIQGNPDLRDPQVEGWFRTRQHFRNSSEHAIRNLMLETMEKARLELPPRVYSRELIELLFHQPYCKIAFLVDAGIASRNIASSYLNELVKINILKKEKIGRETLYLNDKLYELLSKK